MGKRDNRRSMKMRRKSRQRKLKARLKRKKVGRTKAAASAKPVKGKSRPAAPAAKE
jgi:hypothetical protein